jgi:hypothetical protein
MQQEAAVMKLFFDFFYFFMSKLCKATLAARMSIFMFCHECALAAPWAITP